MSVMVVNSDDLGTPFQCPLCRRLFYFDHDYVKHKCIAKSRRMRWAKAVRKHI